MIKKITIITLVSVFILIQIGGSIARADTSTTTLTPQQLQSLYGDSEYYTGQSNSGSSCGASVTTSSDVSLSGSDNEAKVWNYFKSQGLADTQIAGVMGNMDVESHFDPEINQNGDGDTQTQPLVGGADGWGLVQWTYPSQNVQQLLNQYNISGNEYDLATQLSLVWTQMNKTSPTGVTDMISGLNQQTSVTAAADYFQTYFEGGTNAAAREQDAADVSAEFSNSPSPSSSATTTLDSTNPSSNCTTPTTGGSVNCKNVSGNPAILCEAEQWNGIYYHWSGGHMSLSAFESQCPDLSHPPDNHPSGGAIDGDPDNLSGNPSPCAVDCSGLVDLAVDMAFGSMGVDMGGATVSGITTSPYWKSISLNDVEPGDILTLFDPSKGGYYHVEIVDQYTPGNSDVETFGAHATGPTPDGTVTSPLSSWTGGAYRYIGPGHSYN